MTNEQIEEILETAYDNAFNVFEKDYKFDGFGDERYQDFEEFLNGLSIAEAISFIFRGFT